MNSNEREYLNVNLPELQQNIIVDTSLISYLISKSAISDIEKEKMELAILTNTSKVSLLLDIMKTKTNGFNVLLDALKYTGQSGAVGILENILPQSQRRSSLELPRQSSIVNVTMTKPGSTYTLNFEDLEMPKVLKTVQPDLLSEMKVEASNTQIITALTALCFFNHDDISPITLNQCGPQTKRMTELFQLIAVLDHDDIRKCLECLCNLKGLPNISKKVRDVFEEHYKGSVCETSEK